MAVAALGLLVLLSALSSTQAEQARNSRLGIVGVVRAPPEHSCPANPRNVPARCSIRGTQNIRAPIESEVGIGCFDVDVDADVL